MSHKAHTKRRWGIMPLAVVIAVAVLVVPAAAKGPVLVPHACVQSAGKAPALAQTRALCERYVTASRRESVLGPGPPTDGGFSWAAAGVLASLVLVVAGGMLVATRRRGADDTRPVALS